MAIGEFDLERKKPQNLFDEFSATLVSHIPILLWAA